MKNFNITECTECNVIKMNIKTIFESKEIFFNITILCDSKINTTTIQEILDY